MYNQPPPKKQKVYKSEEKNNIKQYQIVSAVFSPKDKDSLNEDEKRAIGKKFNWRAGWIFGRGPYKGQWAFINQARCPTPFAWKPEQDLKGIR